MFSDRLEALTELEEVRQSERALVREVEAIDVRIAAFLTSNELDQASKGGRTAKFRTSVGTKVTDWPAFYAYIIKENRFDLLHKRLSSDPFTEVHNQGIEVPGVETYEYTKLTVTKKG